MVELNYPGLAAPRSGERRIATKDLPALGQQVKAEEDLQRFLDVQACS